MRRSALLCCVIATAGLLAGCTGTGVFLDHTFTGFGNNPNTPAGNSEMFQRLRGESVTVTPLVPESGNVWPGPQKPDPTLQELEAQQQQGGGVAPNVVGGGTDHQQPHPAGTGPTGGPAPAIVQPNGPPGGLVRPPQRTPNGSAVDTTGGRAVPSYRQLQPTPPAGKGILVPNGNGTSTLIGPDGSVSTVPTKP
jgi:hypothetical protein